LTIVTIQYRNWEDGEIGIEYPNHFESLWLQVR